MNANWRGFELQGRRIVPFVIVLCAAWQQSISAVARADVREAVKRILPATVGVEWRKGDGHKSDQVKMGSGTIVSADGLIVTMIEGRESRGYSVTLSDGRVFAGRLLVDDRRSRLKLLKIDASGLPFVAPFSEPLEIGEEIAAVYCLDLKDRAAVRGIVTASNRELKGMATGLLQLDVNVGMMSAGSACRLAGEVAWSHCVSTRRALEQLRFCNPGGAGPGAGQRPKWRCADGHSARHARNSAQVI